MNPSASLPLSPPQPYGGFVLRTFAAVIDLLILAVPLAVFISFLSVAMGISTAFLNLRPGEPPNEILKAFGDTFIYISLGFFLVMNWLYFAILESSRWRATLGKRALGLYVSDLNGNRAAFARTTARFFCGRLLAHIPILGIYYFLIDCAAVPFTQRKQAIHDILSECLVLRETTSSPLAGPGK
jgi:uncharacterized RDD family membrane protein YckC